MKYAIALVVTALTLAGAVPAAHANSYNLFCGGVNCGSVTISNISGGVTMDVTMRGGFSIQANANNGFFFNTSGVSSITLNNFSVTSDGAVGAKFSGTNLLSGGTATASPGNFNGGSLGKFTFDLVKYGVPNGQTGITGLSFTLMGSGLSTSSFVANRNGIVLGIHFCSPGESLNCASPTGFAAGVPVSAVPEPGTLTLLGMGLLGLSLVARRRSKR